MLVLLSIKHSIVALLNLFSKAFIGNNNTVPAFILGGVKRFIDTVNHLLTDKALLIFADAKTCGVFDSLAVNHRSF